MGAEIKLSCQVLCFSADVEKRVSRMNDARDAWEKFLNPEAIRSKLISAGLFLVAHEMLLSSIKRHPLSFFAEHWTAKGPQLSAKYRAEVLALDPK